MAKVSHSEPPTLPNINGELYVGGFANKMVTIQEDGTVIINQPGKIPAAAKQFWESVAVEGLTFRQTIVSLQQQITVLQSQLEAKQAEVAEVTNLVAKVRDQNKKGRMAALYAQASSHRQRLAEKRARQEKPTEPKPLP
jgi:hypothetical protein